MINFEKKNLNYIKSINKDFYKRVIKEKKEGNEKIEIKNRDNFIIKLLINAFKNYDYVQYLRNGNLLIVTTKEDLISIFQFIELNKIIEGWNLLVESYTS